MSARARGLSALAALVLLGGCAQSQIALSVKSPPGTNQDRPMYMLVRKVDPKQYASEAYSEVAAKVGATDTSVVLSAVIYPGTIQRFQVQAPKEGAMAVSFLFTAPDGNWQVLVDPAQTRALDVELTANRIFKDSSPAALPTEMPAAPEMPKPPELPKPPVG